MYCSAPWGEMVLSPAENRVTCCCEYSAHSEGLVLPDGQLRRLEDMWNAPELRRVRRVQAGTEPAPHGCSGCAFSFDQPAPQISDVFIQHDTDELTPAQRANLELARREYADKADNLRSRPVKYVVFFGWGCNISCRICNQVPHRNQLKGKLPIGAYELWRDHMSDAAMIECLGGEPFALPSGLEFMQAFTADRGMDHVRMMITTNATLLDKHLSWLRAKDRISFNVSIDSVGAGYESIRVGGNWKTVEANLRAVRQLITTEKPLWRLKVNALMTRTGLDHLPDFARFLVDTGINSSFHALRPTRGIEETLYQEDILRYPRLLAQTPGWQQKMTEAVNILTEGGMVAEAQSLEGFHQTLRGHNRPPPTDLTQLRPLAAIGRQDLPRMLAGLIGNPGMDMAAGGFRAGMISDCVVLGVNFHATIPADGKVTIRLYWPMDEMSKSRLPCHLVLTDQPDFSLQDWSEHQENGMVVKTMTVSVIGDASLPKRLLLALMPAKVGVLNLLPQRLELLGLA